MMQLPRLTMGVGDRFAQQGEAQLKAFVEAKARGVLVSPVWNKSFREHTIVHSRPEDVRAEADAAVMALGWSSPYFVDADHIRLNTVDGFLATADFFTIDVADSIGKPAPDVSDFVHRHVPRSGSLQIPGIAEPFAVDRRRLESISEKYLAAIHEAGQIYRHIESARGKGQFITEVSMDETDEPQTPLDLWYILVAMADEGLPVRTVAPKFTGRFNKGVDFVGDVGKFEREFGDDLKVIAHAVRVLGLPADLKISVHSGSDKFSLYGPICRVLAEQKAGLHIKTAGTTWLEEVAGLAAGSGLALAKEVYAKALSRYNELAAPYSSVIDINPSTLPTAEAVAGWSSQRFVETLTHEPGGTAFNASFRQLLHVGYKVAAEMGARYLDALHTNHDVIARRVTDNLLRKHLLPLFGGL